MTVVATYRFDLVRAFVGAGLRAPSYLVLEPPHHFPCEGRLVIYACDGVVFMRAGKDEMTDEQIIADGVEIKGLKYDSSTLEDSSPTMDARVQFDGGHAQVRIHKPKGEEDGSSQEEEAGPAARSVQDQQGRQQG